MARDRIAGVPLPKGVEKVRAKGRTYYYWNPGRNTEKEGERIPLPNADTDPAAFWREVGRHHSSEPVPFPRGSVGYVVARWRASEDFKKLAESTQSSYGVTLNRFSKADGWGFLRARDLTPAGVLAARDEMKATPVQANHMLACGRSLWNWAIPLNLVGELNPFDKVKDLDVLDRGHVPWPAIVRDRVLEHAWPDLVRLVQLGVMTCQRESDLIRLGPEQRERNGIWCRPKKTRRRRRAFHIPLQTSEAFTLDRWAETPISFTNSRWLQPIERHREDLYLYSPKGAPYSTTSLRARWNRWLKGTAQGRELCRLWREWVAGQVRKYEWDIDPEEARQPTIHGLRGTGILARYERGHDVDQIANDVGMSRQMVERYMRFKDQMEVGASSRARLRIVQA
jgi:integrase